MNYDYVYAHVMYSINVCVCVRVPCSSLAVRECVEICWLTVVQFSMCKPRLSNFQWLVILIHLLLLLCRVAKCQESILICWLMLIYILHNGGFMSKCNRYQTECCIVITFRMIKAAVIPETHWHWQDNGYDGDEYHRCVYYYHKHCTSTVVIAFMQNIQHHTFSFSSLHGTNCIYGNTIFWVKKNSTSNLSFHLFRIYARDHTHTHIN